MTNTGFRGAWVSPDVSYRMPARLISVTRKFAEQFLPEVLRQVPIAESEELDLYPCTLSWIQVTDSDLRSTAIEAILGMIRNIKPTERVAVADITVIVDSTSLGSDFARQLEYIYHIKCIDTFEKGQAGPSIAREGRRKKLAFFMGDARIKITTLHSFKGWETRLLVMIVTKANTHRALAAVYAGMTRLKRSEHGDSRLTIICSAPELAAFGEAVREKSSDLSAESVENFA